MRRGRKSGRGDGYLGRMLRAARVRNDRSVGGGLFVATLLIFWLSPVRGTTDTQYSMLLSQSLLEHGSFTLDSYDIPRSDAWVADGERTGGGVYQLELARGHVYYHFPHGGAVLSVPFVAVMNLFGVSASSPDGSYSDKGEAVILRNLAALLMAGLTVIFFYTARLMLPSGWSALVALGGALGTQVWSTASRVVWADTWAIFLLGVALWMLLAHETGRRRLSPALLASVLAWTYFAKPTNSVPIAGISVYLLLFHRELFARYAAAGALWLAGFVAYSWVHFGRALPTYYQAGRLQFNRFWLAAAGNLVSPSRGLLVYVPVLLFVIYLLLRHRRHLTFPRLAILSTLIVVGHLIAISGIDGWYGGGCYGPRYSTGLVPFFILLSVLGVRALLDRRRADGAGSDRRRARAQLATGAVLLVLSVFINGRGALSQATAKWNTWPVSVDERPERVWDWSHPQFLAGLLPTPPPDDPPLIEAATKIDFTSQEAGRFLWYGWSAAEQSHRWSEEREAALIFALESAGAVSLRMKVGGYVGEGGVTEQRVSVRLNGHLAGTLLLTESAAREYSLTLAGEHLRRANVLVFELPGAVSPAALGTGSDRRLLAMRVEWMSLDPQTTPAEAFVDLPPTTCLNRATGPRSRAGVTPVALHR